MQGQEKPVYERTVPYHSSQARRSLENVRGVGTEGSPMTLFLLGLSVCPSDSLISWLPLKSHSTPIGNHHKEKKCGAPFPHPPSTELAALVLRLPQRGVRRKARSKSTPCPPAVCPSLPPPQGRAELGNRKEGRETETGNWRGP